MKYDNFEFEDFLKDEQFVEWVLQPTEESNFFWTSWLKHHPEHREKIVLAKEYILSIKIREPEYKVDPKEKDKIFEQVLENRKSDSHWKLFEKRDRGKAYYSIAASIIVLLSLGIWYFSQFEKSTVTVPQLVVKSNPAGRTSRIFLPDGSEVKLGPESRIEYSSSFNAETRSVKLTGTAFFDVYKDPKKAFVVEAGKLTTSVFGTSFVITMKENRNVDVALVSGKVRVEADGHSMDLLPNETARYKSHSKKLEKSRLDYDGDIAWIHGILAFQSAEITEVIKRIESWYGVTIKMEGKVSDYGKLNARFDNKSLEYILNALTYSLNIKYEKNGKEILILKQ
ncbi:FecR domain-containing protein [Fulvivirgaceae bacterium BMA12]|uniref:FecR domain-containing protein n=1 Tax=Agaribacillus aureus TaxID=3051825 RepID=A0ABT8L927_9BACT|nr:FecR domain-containing protein [Fulvivirgaceae bacterium BMA12]